MSEAISGDELERRLRAAFADARATVREHPDLFARVTRSLEEARARRRFRLRLAAGIAGFVLANAALALALSDRQGEELTMDWWVIELITNIVLVALAVALGPFIKRFGRAYAADVFRNNPRTGKSYLVLTDVAYYLIFAAFIMFTITFVEPADWAESTGNQLKHEVARVGGILLVMGVLHTGNVLALPVIGRLLSTDRRAGRSPEAPAGSPPASALVTPPLGPGTWLLRIEPADQPGSADQSGSDDQT
jgi:hypothetical protein